MTLDREEDRQILLQIIQAASVPGGAVLVVAGLIQRIKTATVGTDDPSGADRRQETRPGD